MFLCLLAGLLLARPCLSYDDQLLEMSVGVRQTMARHVGLDAAFLTHKERKWPNGKIPYTYHISIREVHQWWASVEEAIQKLKEYSCLEFVDISDFMDDYMRAHADMKYFHNYFHLMEPPAEYPDYIYFNLQDYEDYGAPTDLCYSEDGRVGGIQAVTLSWTCLTTKPQEEIVGRIQYDILHAVGSLHEMNRSR